MDRKSKAEAVKKIMQAQIKKEEDDFKALHVFPIVRRAYSCFELHGKYQRHKILAEPDMRDAHIPFMHPTNKYKKWVRDHASKDFPELREKAEGDDLKYKYLRKQATRKITRRLRLNSHAHPYTAK